MPEDLTKLWLGHSKESVTDFYAVGLQKDLAWRQEWCERVGLGFGLTWATKTEPAVEEKPAYVKVGAAFKVARSGRFERPTLCFGGTRSIQLSYERAEEQLSYCNAKAAMSVQQSRQRRSNPWRDP